MSTSSTQELLATHITRSVLYLEDAWDDRVMAPRPNLFDDVCVGLSDLSLHPQRVGEVELVQVGVLQEVLGQRRCITQALWEEPGGRRGYRETKVKGDGPSCEI